jgi:hypothetical protein
MEIPLIHSWQIEEIRERRPLGAASSSPTSEEILRSF